jgi:hypothetical protein
VPNTNDTIEQRGKLAACIVTTAPPAPEIVNFQVLVIGGTHAFKVTAGDVDWTNGSGVAKRISAADFSTAQFNHPSAFSIRATVFEGMAADALSCDVYVCDAFSRPGTCHPGGSQWR